MTTTFPAFLVTIVYWILLASSSTFATPYSGMDLLPILFFNVFIRDYSVVQYIQTRFEFGFRCFRDLAVKR